jgi:tetrahydromethanopterin S-methyltransferase subunit G
MLTYTSTKAQDQDNKQQTTEKTEIEELDNSIGNVPFSVVESVPLFPGCENLETNEERKACMSKKISEYVNNNFDTSLPKDLGLEGINRIYIQFKINKKGKVVNVNARAEKPELEVEAERVINGLPAMQPGKQKGQNVGVLYSLPITFQLGENLDKKESQSPITKITEVKEEKVSYSGDVPFAVVESVPVFPGCESLSSNEERRECMSEKISQFVSKNFNLKVAKENGLKGVNRVYVQFKIDKKGRITDINSRAATPELEAEGKRAVKDLPKMKPGQHKGKNVGVLYSLPIKFEIE